MKTISPQMIFFNFSKTSHNLRHVKEIRARMQCTFLQRCLVTIFWPDYITCRIEENFNITAFWGTTIKTNRKRPDSQDLGKSYFVAQQNDWLSRSYIRRACYSGKSMFSVLYTCWIPLLRTYSSTESGMRSAAGET